MTILSIPLGLDAVSMVFFVVAICSVIALIQAGRHYRPRSTKVWYLLAGSLVLFLAGGVAEVLTLPDDPADISLDLGWRHFFDLAGYAGFILGASLMARARLANRDRTITLDALIGIGGLGALAWATIISGYLESDNLSTLGKAIGLGFTFASLTLGFAVIRIAIGPGARPISYYFLAAATAGSFIGELFIELELSGVSIPGSEMLATLASAVSVTMVTCSALHPSMVELTEPPIEATPQMTVKRFVVMTLAVLVPPALLLDSTLAAGGYETVAIIAVWVALSILVMSRVYSLAKTRERFAEIDRALASADAALAGAANRSQMTQAVLAATSEIVSGLHSAAVHRWTGSDWERLQHKGSRPLTPAAPAPLAPMTEVPEVSDDGFRFDIHFQADNIMTGIVSVSSPTRPDSFELGRLSSLVADLSQAIESAALREELVRERSERRFRALVNNSADIIMVLDDHARVQFVSPAGPRLLGRTESELLGAPVSSLAVEAHLDRLIGAIDYPDKASVEVQLTTSSGDVRWFALQVSDMKAEPEIQGLVVTASEISARKQAQLDLRTSEARFRSLVQHASDLVVVLDADSIISWSSPSVSTVLGITQSEAADTSILDVAHPSDRDRIQNLIVDVSTAESTKNVELRFKNEASGWRTLEVTLTNLLDDPSVQGIVLNAHDVTERKSLEQSLRHQALHDDLTGIANRVMFRRQMGESLDRKNDDLAVLVIDLDDFKTINDGLGHSIGDELLKVLASRLQKSLRAGDVAARLGGDEFAVLLETTTERGEVMEIANRLLRAIEEPIALMEREIALHASIGVAFADDVDSATPETMLRSADLAMYGAKNRGKSRVVIFDESMHEGAFERLELKADLAHALDRGELLLHYQPVVDLTTGAISGFEALMRWEHPARGMVGPATFIPLAEETGLIVPIGRWLAHEALTQLRTWQDRFPGSRPFTMSINVSGRQLEDVNVVADIKGAIAQAGVAPSAVIVELTESVVVEDSPDLVRRLNEIRSIGVGLYADDFGAGFASYSALQSLPFTGVKIDRSLVNGLESDAVDRARAQIRSIIEMAATTNMRVVAEGIESGAQADALRRMKCETAQGYFFARPAEPNVIDAELTQRRSLSHSTNG